MPHPIRYTTGSDSRSVKKGNFYMSMNDVDKGPSSSTGYYAGITPPVGGYTIYLNRPSGDFSIYVASNDTELITITNRIAQASYTTVQECLNYFSEQSDKMILDRDLENITTNGLVLYFDASSVASYPKSGTTIYDISGNGYHGKLVNGPTFRTINSGSITFDGTNDAIQATGFTWTPTAYTVSFFVYGNNRLSYNQVIGASNGWANAFVFHTQSDGSIYCGVDTTYRFAPPGIPANTYVTGAYQQFTFAVGGGTGYLYKNGSLISSKSMPNTLAAWGGLTIGDVTSITMNGLFGNILIYNRVLSASEVLSNYNALKDKYVTASIVTTNLTHRFDAGDASSYSGTGTVWTNLNGPNNLSLVNTPTYVSNGSASQFVFDGISDFMTGSGYLTGSAAKSHTLNLIASFASLPSTFTRYRFLTDQNNPTSYGVSQPGTTVGVGEVIISQGTPNFNATVYDPPGAVQFVSRSQTAMFTFVSKNTGIDFYLNGSLLGGTTTDTFVDSSFINPTRVYTWANDPNGTGNFLSMSIAHIMWYSSSLSEAQITQNYYALKNRYGI